MSETGRSERCIQKAAKCGCTSAVMVSHDPLSPTPSTSAVKSPANVEEDPDDCEPDGGGIQVECLFDWL